MGNSGSLIYLDYTFFIQLSIFFASYFVLRSFVFRPFLAVFKMREERTLGLRNEAKNALERADKLKRDYETFMQEQRMKNSTWADEQRRLLNQEERGILVEAKKKANEKLNEHNRQLRVEVEKAEKELSPKIIEFSSEIASQILGYKVQVKKRGDVPNITEEQTVIS